MTPRLDIQFGDGISPKQKVKLIPWLNIPPYTPLSTDLYFNKKKIWSDHPVVGAQVGGGGYSFEINDES